MEIVDAQVSLRYPGERLPWDQGRHWASFESKLEVLREAGISRESRVAMSGSGASWVRNCSSGTEWSWKRPGPSTAC